MQQQMVINIEIHRLLNYREYITGECSAIDGTSVSHISLPQGLDVSQKRGWKNFKSQKWRDIAAK